MGGMAARAAFCADVCEKNRNCFHFHSIVQFAAIQVAKLSSAGFITGQLLFLPKTQERF